MINYHYAELIYRQAEKYGNRTALRYRDDGSGRWLRVSWNDFAEKVRLTAMAMAEFGIQVQENIGVCSQNMPADLRDQLAGANRLYRERREYPHAFRGRAATVQQRADRAQAATGSPVALGRFRSFREIEPGRQELHLFRGFHSLGR